MLKQEFLVAMQTKMNEAKALREEKNGTKNTSGYTLGQVEDAISGFTKTTLDVMSAGDSISFQGFGKYSTAHRNSRTGKVPGTDKIYNSPAKYVPRFTFTEAVIKSIAEANASRI